MTIFREYRVVMPMSVDEYRKARQWHKVEKLCLDVELLRLMKHNDYPERLILQENTARVPFWSKTLAEKAASESLAEHTIKQYGQESCSTKSNLVVDAWRTFGAVSEAILSGAVKITELEAWDCFPYHRSVSRNESMRTNYEMVIECAYLPGNGEIENALMLPPAILEKREVFLVDIAENIKVEDYRDGKDPSLFVSEKTGRGKLRPGLWMEKTNPCMTCYVVVAITFDLPPVGNWTEDVLQNHIFRSLGMHHRELFCLIDKWIDFSLSELELMEKETQQRLDEACKRPEILGKTEVMMEGADENEKPSEAGGGSCCPLTMFSNTMCGGKFGTLPAAGVVACVIVAALCCYGSSKFMGYDFL